MKALRSALLCAAIAGALSAAADPVGTLRVKSVADALAFVRDAAALADQPFAAVMAESQLRSALDESGVELREDAPILFAIAPNPAAEDDLAGDPGRAGMVRAMRMLSDPPAMAFAVPMGPLPADLLESILDTTNAPAPGEWAANEAGDTFYSHRDGYALLALKEKGRALAESLVAAKPARADALFEMTVDDPAEFQKRMDMGNVTDEALAAVFDEIAETLGLPGFGDRLKILAEAAEKVDRETERFVVDAWFDATNGLAVAASRVAREGSDLAARIAAAPALDPAAAPGVPAGAPFWIVQADDESPDADTKALCGAVRALVEGPAPSGDAAATAQRAAAVRMIDANLAALPATGAMALYATADSEGRPALAVDTRLRDAAPARALLDTQIALLESFPALASNGVAVVRERPGALRVDVSTADAFVGLARLGYEIEKLDKKDDGSDLWIDDEEDDDCGDWDDDEEDDDKVEVAAAEKADGAEKAEAADGAEKAEADDDDDAFDEAEARELAKQLADAIGETVAIRDEIAEDGSAETFVVSAPGAKLPAAQGAPDLAPSLALGKAILPAGAKPFGAGAFSCRAAVAAFLPSVVRLAAAMDDPMDEDDIAKAKAFADGEEDFGFRFLSATEGRTIFVSFAVPRKDVEAAAKFLRESKPEASFDFEDDEGVDLDDDDDDDFDDDEEDEEDEADE